MLDSETVRYARMGLVDGKHGKAPGSVGSNVRRIRDAAPSLGVEDHLVRVRDG